MSQTLNYIDLFAGCGGLSLGLHHAGWRGLFAIEKSSDAFKTLEFNLINTKKHFDWPEWLPNQHLDINYVIETYKSQLKSLRNTVDLVAGGPPCQGFSMAGQRKENDERNKLINSYIEFVSLVKPKLIFFENVKGFTLEFKKNNEKGKRYSQIVTNQLNKKGYYVYGKLVNFGEFGIPQKRTRFILVGIRKDLNGASVEKARSFFEQIEANRYGFLDKKELSLKPTIKEAISDLLTKNTVETPDRKGFKSSEYNKISSDYQRFVRNEVKSKIPNSHSFAKHSDRITQRLTYIQQVSTESKNLSDEFKQKLGITKQVLVPLQPESQAPTITSHPDDLIHYCEPRILTVREYARLQSFPDWFEFKGKYTTGGILRRTEVPRYTQIGNAIPPLFGEQSGLVLKELLG
jgi:DNA (cytosine-5)-methyltransferase 1